MRIQGVLFGVMLLAGRGQFLQEAACADEPLPKPGPEEIVQEVPVLDEDRQPVIDATVTIEHFRKPIVLRTNEKGRFAAVIPKSVRRALQFTATDGTRQGYIRLPASRDPDRPLSPRIVLKPARRLTVNVVDADEKPLANAQVGVGVPWGWMRKGVTSEAGVLTLDVPADRSKDRKLAAIIEITADDTQLKIPLASTATVSGRLVNKAGKPIAGRKLTSGVRAHQGDKDAPFMERFGTSATAHEKAVSC